MNQKRAMTTAAARPLSPADLRPRDRRPLPSSPSVIRLGTRILDAVVAALGSFGASAPRVTVESIALSGRSGSGDDNISLRFESRVGSMSVLLVVERAVLFAICETAFGGPGTEDPFTDMERPLSAIELRLRKSFTACLGKEMTAAFSAQFAMPVSTFDLPPGEDEPALGKPDDYLCFRYLVNIFGYSGELCLLIRRVELALQLSAADGSELDISTIERQRSALQRRVAEAQSLVQVSLAAETLVVEQIASMKPGKLLTLTAQMSTPVVVSCGGTAMFSGELIRTADRLAVRLTGTPE